MLSTLVVTSHICLFKFKKLPKSLQAYINCLIARYAYRLQTNTKNSIIKENCIRLWYFLKNVWKQDLGIGKDFLDRAQKILNHRRRKVNILDLKIFESLKSLLRKWIDKLQTRKIYFYCMYIWPRVCYLDHMKVQSNW